MSDLGVPYGPCWLHSKTGKLISFREGEPHSLTVFKNQKTFGVNLPDVDPFEDDDDLLVRGAVNNGWMRIIYYGNEISFECLQNGDTKSTMIEVCSFIKSNAKVYIDWVPFQGNTLQGTVAELIDGELF